MKDKKTVYFLICTLILIEIRVTFEIKSIYLIWMLHFIVITVHMNEVS